MINHKNHELEMNPLNPSDLTIQEHRCLLYMAWKTNTESLLYWVPHVSHRWLLPSSDSFCLYISHQTWSAYTLLAQVPLKFTTGFQNNSSDVNSDDNHNTGWYLGTSHHANSELQSSSLENNLGSMIMNYEIHNQYYS